MVQCPTCQGARQSTRLIKPVEGDCYSETSTCHRCHGAGEISLERATLLVERQATYRARIARRESLRDAAARTGQTPVALSRWERGEDV